MRRLLSTLRSPLALGGLLPAAIVLTVLVASLATGGFTLAQEDGTATPTVEEQVTPTEEEATPAEEEATPSEEEVTPAEDDTLRDQFLDDLAERLGVSRDQLDQAIGDSALALVDQAAADGRITEEEAARIRERIEAGDFPFFGFGRHHGGFLCGPLGVDLEETAEFLGLTMTELHDALTGGQSLAQIAEAQGTSREELTSFLLGEVEQRLNEAVANGRITQEEADEKLQQASERIDELIDREGLPGPGKGRFRLPDEDGASESETGLTL